MRINGVGYAVYAVIDAHKWASCVSFVCKLKIAAFIQIDEVDRSWHG